MISSRVWSKPGISSLSLKIKGVGLGYKSEGAGEIEWDSVRNPKM